MRKYRILLSAAGNRPLIQLVQDRLRREGIDLFSFEPDSGSLDGSEKVALVVSLSGRRPSAARAISSDIRHVRWILPLERGEEALSAEIRFFLKELVQTFASPTTESKPLNDRTWSRYYIEGKTAWDLAEPSPPFVGLHKRGLLNSGEMVIPGCGTGNEVLYFAKEGFKVTAIDFAEQPLQIVRARLERSGLKANLIREDFLNLSGRFQDLYDIVLEQTCYCAIEPIKRAEYVWNAYRILKKGGKYIGLFYDIDNQDGPPFGTSVEEIRHRFSPYFNLESLEPCPDSHPKRTGKEWLGRFTRRS